jgi:hypothetical protein
MERKKVSYNDQTVSEILFLICHEYGVDNVMAELGEVIQEMLRQEGMEDR